MIRAVFLDIDGTLVSFQTHRIPNSAERALRAARQNGVKLFIATGRHTQVMAEGDILGDFPYDGYVTLNGQYCYTPEELIYHRFIPHEDIRALVAQLERDPYPCLFVERDRLYINRITDRVRTVHRSVNLRMPDVRDIHEALGRDVYQLNIYVDREGEAYPLSALAHCDATRWSPLFCDIVPKGGSKRVGVERMLGHFGIAPEEIMALGDGENDMEMLRYAGIGVAMGNASDIVKSAADYVTDEVDHDGLENAFRHFGVI